MDSHPTLQLTISDVAFGGKGVARHEGKVYFVPFTIPGETVTVRVVRQKKNFAEAELISVDTPSPDRVEPRCPYFGRCGGCAYQHVAYARQLDIKGRQVEQTIRRLGKIESVPMRPTVASPKEYGYRNRVRVHVEGGCVGFYAHGSHTLIDIEICPISSEGVNEALKELRQTPVADGDYTVSARRRGPFFEQTNDAVAEAMAEFVTASVRRGQKLLVDAYSGAGFFAKRFAGIFEKVVGIEENAHAVENARRNAQPNESYIAGDVAVHLGEVLSMHEPQATTIVLDPPAQGVSPRVSDILLMSRPAEIIYVSCDPATLARDLGTLCRSTYQLESVTPFDMFPQTAEIETVARLLRR